jgi:hypothetical protein
MLAAMILLAGIVSYRGIRPAFDDELLFAGRIRALTPANSLIVFPSRVPIPDPREL